MAKTRPRMAGKLGAMEPRTGSLGPQSKPVGPGKPANQGPALARTVGGSGQRNTGNYKSSSRLQGYDRTTPPERDQRGGQTDLATQVLKGGGSRMAGPMPRKLQPGDIYKAPVGRNPGAGVSGASGS